MESAHTCGLVPVAGERGCVPLVLLGTGILGGKECLCLDSAPLHSLEPAAGGRRWACPPTCKPGLHGTAAGWPAVRWQRAGCTMQQNAWKLAWRGFAGCRQCHTCDPRHQAHRIDSQAAVSKRHTACRACSPCSLWPGQDQGGDMLSTTLHGLQGVDKAVIEAVFYGTAQAHPLLLLSRVVEGDVVGEDDLLVLARHPGNDQRDLHQSPFSTSRCHQLPDDLVSDKHLLVSEALCELSLLAEHDGRTATRSSTLAAARVGLAAQSLPPAAAALQPSHVWRAFTAYGLHVLRPDHAPAHCAHHSVHNLAWGSHHAKLISCRSSRLATCCKPCKTCCTTNLCKTSHHNKLVQDKPSTAPCAGPPWPGRPHAAGG